jgi:hypothetical protein
VFERLFGDSDAIGRAGQLARWGSTRSILDSVTEAAGRLARTLAADDRARLDEYFEALRDIERRIQQAERQDAVALPEFGRPIGVPRSFPEHARLMFDLQVLAYQADVTRVITFMTGRELSGRSYPEIDIRDAHHPISHHQGDPVKLAKLTTINTHHIAQLAYFLERLRSSPDGDGTLLDHMTMMYGAGIADSNAHATSDIPVVLVGGGAGTLKGGRHIRFTGLPLANMHLTLLDQFGVRWDRIGDSTGKLDANLLSL